MSEHRPAWTSPDDVQTLENALADSQMPGDSRRALIRRASIGLLAFGGGAASLAGCGSSSTGSSASATAATPFGSSGAEIKKIIDAAITAEALAVTYLTAVVTSSGVARTPVGKFVPVLKAANAAEYDHYKVLGSLGAKPLTTKFWAPHAFFGHNLDGVFPTLEVAETLFVNAYLIAITAFAKAGKTKLVRYASEIAGVEAQHLALARYAAGKLPNDLGFADYSITSIDGIVAALERAGVGFGARGSKSGSFVTFTPPPPGALMTVTHPSPR